MKKWILLDNESSVSIFCNEDFVYNVRNIEENQSPLIVETNGGIFEVNQKANVFIFPNLSSGNLAYKILRGVEESTSIGPILMGMAKPAHILQMRSSIEEIVNLATISVLDAQIREKQ